MNQPLQISVTCWGTPSQIAQESFKQVLTCGQYIVQNEEIYINPKPISALTRANTIPTGEEGAENIIHEIPPNTLFAYNQFPGETKKCKIVKDLVTQNVYYLDYDSLATQSVNCNRVPYVTSCNPVTSGAASSITATTATVTWGAVAGASGYIYANTTSGTEPSSGTFIATNTKALTGLTTGTDYHFWVQVACTGGSQSEWFEIEFTTT